MAAPANPKEEGEEENSSSSSSSSSSRPFASAVAAIAVAQICGGAGFTAAEPCALRALSDVAALYIEALARSAAGHANDRGRTDSNLLDLVRALEELEAAACGGFLGGSDPARLLLRSSKLMELMAFVRDADEVPFAKPIRRRAGKGGERRRAPPSFVEAGKEPPMPHVPRWLPCFPESWEGWGRRGEKEMAAKEEEEEEMAVGTGMDGVVKREESGVAGVLPEERARVRFRIGAGSDRRRRGR
ncbi:transcription initiation factor TFIID subunit 8-like [Ananas comosus]|uniref:Transcription initiation factor TFIID subunit 8-like n=1 Tax=Ananas comosus TaxID=4615 RepID=A0A6P5ELU5_ANACO|nr:transcription initiation factor TFIID subunit 8-like [Ananas comosus]